MALGADQSLDDMSDEQLVEAYRQGREEAFPALVNRYRQELFHFLVRFMGRRAAAEDVFQDAFLQVHLSIDKFDTSRRFKPWLFTIAANKGRDFMRKKMRRQTVPLSAPVSGDGSDEREFVDLLQDDLPLPTEAAETGETQRLVKEVVDSLPDHLREILLLAYFEQFAYKEIAEMLDIPLGTVKSRLHAAVGTFSQMWKLRFTESQEPAEPGQGSSE